MPDPQRSPLKGLTAHKEHSANLQATGRAATALLGESIPTTCHLHTRHGMNMSVSSAETESNQFPVSMRTYRI